jgi:hypothetical protein
MANYCRAGIKSLHGTCRHVNYSIQSDIPAPTPASFGAV